MVAQFTPRERNVINFVIGLGEAFTGGRNTEAFALSEPAINFAESQGLELAGTEILALVRRAGFQQVRITRPPLPVQRRARRLRLRVPIDELRRR